MEEKNIAIVIIAVVAILSILTMLKDNTTGMLIGGRVQHSPETGNCLDLNNECGTWEPFDNESRWCISTNYKGDLFPC